MKPPPVGYPRAGVGAETLFQQWEQQYSSVSSRYAACRLIRQIGPSDVHPDIEPILSLHDRLACSDYNLTLA